MSKPILIVSRQTANDGSVLVQASIEEASDNAASPALSPEDQYFANAEEGQNIRYVIKNNTSLFNVGIERGGVSIFFEPGKDMEVRPGDVLVMAGAGTFQRMEIPSSADGSLSFLRGLSVALSSEPHVEDTRGYSRDPEFRHVKMLFEDYVENWEASSDQAKRDMLDDFMDFRVDEVMKRGASLPLHSSVKAYAKARGIETLPTQGEMRQDAVEAQLRKDYPRLADSHHAAAVREIAGKAIKRAIMMPTDHFHEAFQEQASKGEEPIIRGGIPHEILTGFLEDLGFVRKAVDKAETADGLASLCQELRINPEEIKAAGEENLSKVIYLRLKELEDVGGVGKHEVLWNELQSAVFLMHDHPDIFSTIEKRDAFRMGIIRSYAMTISGLGAGESHSVERFVADFLRGEAARSTKTDALIDEARRMDETFRERMGKDREKLEVKK